MHLRSFYYFCNLRVKTVLVIILIIGDQLVVGSSSLPGYTPCTFPVPSDERYGTLCSTSFVNANFLCDVHKHVDKTDADRILNVVAKYESYKRGHVSVGIAVMQKLTIPEALPDASDFLVDSEWYCFTAYAPQINDVLHWKNATTVLMYLDKFASVLRRRWFRSECGWHVVFLTITESVDYADQSSDKTHLLVRPVVRISFGKDMERKLGERFIQSLTKSVFVWHNEGLSALRVVASALEKIGEKIDADTDTGDETEFEGVPVWAILSFVGCFLAIGFLMFLDYAIVRKNGLTLRGSKEPKLLPAGKKKENVSVHLYF